MLYSVMGINSVYGTFSTGQVQRGHPADFANTMLFWRLRRLQLVYILKIYLSCDQNK